MTVRRIRIGVGASLVVAAAAVVAGASASANAMPGGPGEQPISVSVLGMDAEGNAIECQLEDSAAIVAAWLDASASRSGGSDGSAVEVEVLRLSSEDVAAAEAPGAVRFGGAGECPAITGLVGAGT